jgi:hypothetical protein
MASSKARARDCPHDGTGGAEERGKLPGSRGDLLEDPPMGEFSGCAFRDSLDPNLFMACLSGRHSPAAALEVLRECLGAAEHRALGGLAVAGWRLTCRSRCHAIQSNAPTRRVPHHAPVASDLFPSPESLTPRVAMMQLRAECNPHRDTSNCRGDPIPSAVSVISTDYRAACWPDHGNGPHLPMESCPAALRRMDGRNARGAEQNGGIRVGGGSASDADRELLAWPPIFPRYDPGEGPSTERKSLPIDMTVRSSPGGHGRKGSREQNGVRVRPLAFRGGLGTIVTGLDEDGPRGVAGGLRPPPDDNFARR